MLLTIGLGSNLGNKLVNLKKAIYQLKSSGIFSDNIEIKLSKIYQTAALLKKNAPKEWAIDYLNMNICGESNMPAELILHKTQYIENLLGRKQDDDIWAPRIIDIDILLYGDLIISSDKLTVPHLELCKRAWCVKPISELSDKIIDPISKKSFAEIYQEQFQNYNLQEYNGSIND